jgi:hypothetical protein
VFVDATVLSAVGALASVLRGGRIEPCSRGAGTEAAAVAA